MAITYNNLDDYLLGNASDKIDDPDFLKLVESSSSFFHQGNGSYFNVFKDSVNGYFHIPKDTILKITKTIGLITTSTGYMASADFILKSTDSFTSGSSITALFTSNATIKWYNSKKPLPEKAYLAYKNFDNKFDFKRTYSVATYPGIKIDANSYRDRMGDGDLNGNVKINTQQALCSSLKEAYKINGEAVGPDTYKKYTPANNTGTHIEPELTTSTNIENIDSNDDRINPQTVGKGPQRDYLFDGKYITSCDITPEIRGGKDKSPYQFSKKYKTQFAKTILKGEQPQKVVNMGFTSVKWLGKILQQPVEDFNKGSIKSLTVSWTDDTKTECNITAVYDTDSGQSGTKIPKNRTLDIRIRLPGPDGIHYGEERLKRPRDHRPPIQLPGGQYSPSDNTIKLYGAGSGGTVHDWQKTYDGTGKDCRQNEPGYSKGNIQSISTGGIKYIPQLKINFSNKYYYVSTKLEELFEGRGNVKSITVLLYTGQFKSTMGGDRISFNCSDGGKIEFDIETIAEKAGEQWGGHVKTLKHSGSMNDGDRGLIYLTNGQSEFNDFYSINGRSDSDGNTLSGSLHIFNNIDLFGSIETITDTDSFAKLFHAPQHQINGWITTCDPAGLNNGYVVLDGSYNLVLKNRLLPYADQMFLPITDWKERHLFRDHDEVLNQTLSRFANNQDTGSTRQPFFGYNVGVRVYNASQNDCDRDTPIGEQGPWIGKEFTVRYDKDTGDNANRVDDPSALYGSYRARNSMAWQFEDKSDTWLNEYFTDEDHLIAPPVGLVLE